MFGQRPRAMEALDMNSITKKCNTCHKESSEIKNWRCPDCNKKYYSDYYKKNAEKKKQAAREHSKTYYQENKTKKRKYQLDNWEKISARMKAWWPSHYAKEPEKEAAKRSRRRALLKNLDSSFTKEEWKELCVKYDNTCLKCGVKGNMTPDHVVPLSKGGKGTIDNIQPLCRSCNCSKRDKTIDYRS